jgi:hypothetical protein
MSLHRKCCCGCESVYRVFVPCDETDGSVNAKMVATTVTALDLTFGPTWEDAVMLFNGACACDAYCGTWQCDTRANPLDDQGRPINICTAVPCDEAISYNPCPECNDEDEDLPFVNVRPNDVVRRFTLVATDCCDDVCPTTCEQNPKLEYGDCGNWTYPDDYGVPDPILTAGGVSWTGILGQSATLTIDSYQKVDYIVNPLTSSTSYLFKVSWTITMGNFIEANGAYCPSGGPPSTSTSGWFYHQLYVQACGSINDPDELGNCLGIDYVSIDDAQNVPADFRGRGNPDPVRGRPCPNDSMYVDLTTYNGTSPVQEDECARYETSSSSHAVFRLAVKGTYPLGSPPSQVANVPAGAFYWEMPITYPADPTP